MPSPQPLLVITTLPDADSARRVAAEMVEQGLAACVNISAPVTSVYRWQGRLEQGSEVMLTIKTTVERYPALEATLSEHHPYELPELIAVPITHGLPAYLDWIRACSRD
jgi:periplasmic divalent cation tolerance protein